METEKKVVLMDSKEQMVNYLRNTQGVKPFKCRHLLVAKETIKCGRDIYEKGSLICVNGFIDSCFLFERALADEEGKLIARCGKHKESLEVVFKRQDQ